jgi:hypothetical protein
MNCCVANGPRGLMLLPALAVMRDRAGPVVEFYEAGTALMPLASGRRVQLRFKGDYPRHGDVEIVVQPDGPEPFTLALRIPAWSWRTTIEVNGQAVPDVKPGTYARLARQWKPGDRVRLKFDLAVRAVREPGGSSQVAILRGPVVLALDRRITQPQAGAKVMVKTDARGVIAQATEVHDGLPEGIRFAIDVPCVTADGKAVSLRMCDFASAGRTWSADSALRVWLPQPLDLEHPLAP